MDKPSVDIAAELVRLEALTLFELKGEWRRLHRTTPPKRLSRDLLMRGITHKIQERRLGGLSSSILRRMEGLNAEAAPDKRRPIPPISLKAGARLVREWRGVTHSVLVHDDGFEWRGMRYGSLTTIAQEITGAHWSGPRFFGLRKLPSRSAARAESDNAKS
jgi:hypothetical protein